METCLMEEPPLYPGGFLTRFVWGILKPSRNNIYLDRIDNYRSLLASLGSVREPDKLGRRGSLGLLRVRSAISGVYPAECVARTEIVRDLPTHDIRVSGLFMPSWPSRRGPVLHDHKPGP